MITNIYKLYDPREPNIVRYIGKTNRRKLSTRLSKHICHLKQNNRNYYSAQWINKLISNNVLPSIELIDKCSSLDWEFWEKFYIRKYKSDKLTNTEPGRKSVTLRSYNKVNTSKNTKPI